MPLTETDILRIRQFIQQMESGLILGQQVFATYHDSNLAATPSDPTGDGTTGGWHRLATEASNWMSVKTALSDSAGTWGTPIRVFGLQGTETAGVGLSADIPKLTQITFIGDGGSKVGWTAGTVEYGGNSYAIAVKAVGDGSTDAYIYWDDADGQTSFKTTNTFATAIAANHWVVCINDTGKAIPATSARILHGGLIQADTITANEIVAETITYNELFHSGDGTNEAVDTSAIRDDSTMLTETASTAAETGFIPHNTWTTVQEDTIVSEGGRVSLGGGVTITNYDASSRSASVALWDASAQIGDAVSTGSLNQDESARVTVFQQAFPGSGSATYRLRILHAAGAASIKAKLRDIILEESLGK